MDKQKSNNNALIFTLVGAILVLIVIVAGGTYAFYSASIKNSNGGNNTTNISTTKIEFNLEDGTITGDNLIPGDVITKTFKIRNNGNIEAKYNIMWKSVTNEFVNKNDLIVTLEEDGNSIITASENVTLPNTTTTPTVLKSNLTLAAGATKSYTLKITYKNTDQNQSLDMGKGISATIELGA